MDIVKKEQVTVFNKTQLQDGVMIYRNAFHFTDPLMMGINQWPMDSHQKA